MRRIFAIALVCFALVAIATNAQAVPLAVFEDFSGYTGAGFAPTPAAGQLDSDIFRVEGVSDGDTAFGDTNTAGDYARGSSTGGVSGGGIYAFNVGGTNGVALGFQPTGSDLTPGAITMRTINNSGATVNAVSVTYDVCVLNNASRANSLNFAYSTDDVTYTPVPAADFTSPEAEDSPAAWSCVTQAASITGLTLPNNGLLYFQWQLDDVSGSGSRDEFAIDDISADIVDTTAVQLTSNGTASSTPLLPLVIFIALLVVSTPLLATRRK